MTTNSIAGFQLTTDSALAYQRYLVPAFFTPCTGRLLDAAEPRPGDRILDVACGTGVVALAAARAAEAADVTGTDVNDEMLAVAGSVAADAPRGAAVRWRRAAAEALPFDDASFDLVYCQQGLQFFPDRASALAQMHRVLAPGGRVAVAMWRSPEHHAPFTEVAAIWDEFLGEGVGNALRTPFSGPPADELRSLFRQAGFADVRLRIGIITARFPSVGDMLRHEALATPAAPAFAAADDATVANMVDRLSRSLAWAVDDEGVAFPMQTWLVTGVRR